MEDQRDPGRGPVPGEGFLEQWLEERGAFGIRDQPAYDPSTEDVDDDVEVEIGPLHGTHQFGDVPRPDLVGTGGEQLGLDIDGMAHLATAFANLVVFGQDPIQGADRADIAALVEQAGVDFRRSQIDEARLVQEIQHGLSFRPGERASWAGPWVAP